MFSNLEIGFRTIPSFYLRKYTLTDMEYIIRVLFVLCLMIFCVKNAMIPLNFPNSDMLFQQENYFDENRNHPLGVLGLKDLQKTTIRYDYFEEGRECKFPLTDANGNSKPCSMMPIYNNQNTVMQSLLRKYRYDAKGMLIPSSVKYYLKMPQGAGVAPILIPLTGKAFSPLGGFVRYYKEVPPIPPTLLR